MLVTGAQLACAWTSLAFPPTARTLFPAVAQLGSKFPVPVILVDYDNFYSGLLEFLKASVLLKHWEPGGRELGVLGAGAWGSQRTRTWRALAVRRRLAGA